MRAILDAWRAAIGPAGRLAGRRRWLEPGRRQVREVIERAAIDGFGTTSLLDRFDQFVEESETIIPAAASAGAGDLARFGTWWTGRSTSPSTCWETRCRKPLRSRHRRELGAAAASAFGAGFGGSVWALVPEGAAAEFAGRWARDTGRVSCRRPPRVPVHPPRPRGPGWMPTRDG